MPPCNGTLVPQLTQKVRHSLGGAADAPPAGQYRTGPGAQYPAADRPHRMAEEDVLVAHHVLETAGGYIGICSNTEVRAMDMRMPVRDQVT